MALNPCPECDGSVSDQAQSCPHCGFPVETSTGSIPGGTSPLPKNTRRIGLLIFGGCFGVACLIAAGVIGVKMMAVSQWEEELTNARMAQASSIVNQMRADRGMGRVLSGPQAGSFPSIAPFHGADPMELTPIGNVTIQLVSDHPWPNRANRQLDPFQIKALEFLTVPGGGASTSTTQTVNGKKVLRVAIPDVMKASCVQCHNNTAGYFRDAKGAKWMTPKWDWKVGDVRGIFDVTIPLEFP